MGNTQLETWFCVEEIPQDTQFMMQILETFFQNWPRYGYGDKLKKYYSHFKGDTCGMNFVRSEFDQNAEYLSKKMFDDPGWALNQLEIFKDYNDKYFHCAEKYLSIDFTDLSDKELVELLLGCKKYHFLSHGVAGSLTWQADADQERFTKAVIEMIEKKIKDRNLDINGKVIFPILSTPIQESYISKEEQDFLKLGVKIYNSEKIKGVFINKKTDDILNNIKILDKKIFNDIYDHYKKYCWLSYQYKGPAEDISDYLERWQTLMKGKLSPKKILKKLTSDKNKKIAEQNRLLNILKFSEKHENIIKLAQELIYLKDYRKAVLFHGMYCAEKVLKEIGKRLYLSLDQVRTMSYDEISGALLKKKFDVNELNERIKECVYYYEKDKYEIYIGEKLHKFLQGIKKEEVKVEKTNELFGTIACQGKIKSRVKIINIPEEMDKMNKGDIMVARTTNPNLVPAMAKAGGLISEDGGLTCHTAIVAREMNKPCLVGVKNATLVLNDNDKVFLDAQNGKIIICKN